MAPPSLAGVLHVNEIWAFPGVATKPEGAPGVVRGVAQVGVDGFPNPALLYAATMYSYGTPLTRPVSENIVVVGYA